MPPIIEIENLRFSYPKSDAPTLRGVNLKIEKGELFIILGPNGAGKTTLALCMVGVIPNYLEGSYSGRVLVDGLEVSKQAISKVSTKIGLILQDPESQIIGITVKDDVAFGPCNLGLSKDEVFNRVRYALRRVRLDGYEERETFRLSGGEKQRVAIAGILAMAPEIIVADEPTSELDPIGKKEVFETMLKLRDEEDKTIVLITHETDWAVRYADRIGVLSDGKFSFIGSPKELISELGDEGLKKCGVRPPQASELYFEMKKRNLIENSGPWLTIEEASRDLRRILERRGRISVASNSEMESVERYSNSEEVIVVEDLWHVYPGGIEALKGISMKVYKGEHLAIIGQNGSGKTTLMKHFNGLLKPTRGRVLVSGIDTRDATVPELSRKVGYVFQNPDHQIFCSSVREEIMFGLKNMGLTEEEAEERYRWALEFVGLEGKEDEHPFKLSKADRQLLAVASVLALKPEIIVVDEPTTGQDWRGVERIMGMLDELKKMGHTIITVTHDMRVVAEHADRVIVMYRGRILAQGHPKEIFSMHDILAKTYLDPPPITKIASSLSDMGVPSNILSVEEALSVFSKMFR